MLIKLQLERLLRIRNPLDGGHGNLELKIAKSADSDSRDGSQPLEYPQSPLFHSQSFSQQSNPAASAQGKRYGFSQAAKPPSRKFYSGPAEPARPKARGN